MTSLADIPSEAQCKQLIYELTAKQKSHVACGERITWKRNVDYGWCRICRVKIRPKAAMWFRGSKLSYRALFKLLWCWQSRQSPGSVRSATGLSYQTIQRWYARFRDHIPPDSGEMLSSVVAVDEAWFGKKKYGRQMIVMGGIEVDTRRLRLQVIPDADQDSIELFLQSWVSRDSHLITDAAMAYNDIEWLGYTREAYNHSQGHFGQSNHIECIWSAMKCYMRKLYGCIPTKYLQSILSEWMARHNQRSLFESPQNYLRATVVPY
ncbi:MAG: IS1595 family transposase [Candidatus Saccharimonas sp.]